MRDEDLRWGLNGGKEKERERGKEIGEMLIRLLIVIFFSPFFSSKVFHFIISRGVSNFFFFSFFFHV